MLAFAFPSTISASASRASTGLRDFTFDKVKIDRAFVSRISSDRPSKHIIKAIVAMCDSLDLEVVADGLEERVEKEKLRALGCAHGMGLF